MATQQRRQRAGSGTLIGIGLLALAAPLAAQDEARDAATDDHGLFRLPPVDTADWACESCPDRSGWSGFVDLGAGFVSDDSFDFGHYRGLEEQGAFPVLGADLRYRGDDRAYLDVLGERLGTDSRALAIEGGQQGSYRLFLDYLETPSLVSDDTRTVFLGAGSASQSLPADWVRADTTAGMTALDTSLRRVDIEQERESIAVGVQILPGSNWRANVSARQSTREGNRILGGSFFFRAAELAAPVDYETQQVNASIAYVRERWQVEAGYLVSTFDNADEALRWDNPFTSATGADAGQLALPPDNQFHQVSLAGSWRSATSLTVAGQVAVGRLEQDEDFLPATINSSLGSPALPRDDLGGEVDTRDASLRVTGDLTGRLSAAAELDYSERDNETPRDDFVQVASDSLISDTRTNLPFSYERSGAEFTLDYRVSSALRLSGSAGRAETERDFQASERTETDTVALEVAARPADRVGLNLRQSLEQRDSEFDPDALDPAQNPDLRSYHLAERERRATRAAVDLALTDRVSAAVSTEFGRDDYSDSDIGLAESDFRSYAVDVSALVADTITTYGFATFEILDAEVLGADNVSGAPWTGIQRDRFWTLGAGIESADLPGRWTRGGLDLSFAVGEGELRVDKGGGEPAFPELQTQRITLELFANRQVGRDLELRLGYLVEDLREDDFHRDDVDPDTIPTVLTLGDEAAAATVQVLQVAVRYRF